MTRAGEYSYSVEWSDEDQEYVGLCREFPSLSWLEKEQDAAFSGIRKLVADVVADMRAEGEEIPAPVALRKYSGTFKLRIAPELHRALVKKALDNRMSLNGYIELALGAQLQPRDIGTQVIYRSLLQSRSARRTPIHDTKAYLPQVAARQAGKKAKASTRSR